MKEVSWIVKCTTLVNVDDDEEARQQVDRMFEDRGRPTDCGKCLATLEGMAILNVSEASITPLKAEPIREH